MSFSSSFLLLISQRMSSFSSASLTLKLSLADTSMTSIPVWALNSRIWELETSCWSFKSNLLPCYQTDNYDWNGRVVHVVLVWVDSVLDHFDFVEGGQLGHREHQNECIALADQSVDRAVKVVDSLKVAKADFVLLVLELVSDVLDFHESRNVLRDKLLVADAADDWRLSSLGYRLQTRRAGGF